MRRKEVLLAAVIGGVVGAVLVMAAGSIAPLGAQNEAKDAEFGQITCRAIKVVDSEGNSKISLRPGHIFMRGSGNYLHVGGEVLIDGHGDFGSIKVNGQQGSATMLSWVSGGNIVLSDKDNQKEAVIGIGEHGGLVEVRGKTGKTRIGIDEDGGSLHMFGKGHERPPVWLSKSMSMETARYPHGTRTGIVWQR